MTDNYPYFTKGPWQVQYANDGGFEITDSVPKPYGDDNYTLVIASRGNCEHRAEELRADAYLIAAAPEMFDVIEDAITGMMLYGMWEGPFERVYKRLKEIRQKALMPEKRAENP